MHRKVYPQVPPRVEYSPTELGRSLETIILAMSTWGEAYQQRAPTMSPASTFAVTD